MRNYPETSEQYIFRVMDGTEIVCKTVRLAVERHAKDLEKSAQDPEYPFYFDPAAGARVCKLFGILRPSKWPTPIQLQPWQVCMIMLLYGWKKKADHMRRFRIAFIMLPRKTGKSALVSGFGLYALEADGELGPEVYAAALVEDQARRVFDEAVAMRDGTPELHKNIQKSGSNPCRRLITPKTAGVFRPLSRDKENMEGLNISFAGCDELHKWKGRGAWDVIRYGMRSRPQPLLVGITTAPSADDTTSICNTLLDYSHKVLEGIVPDEAFFAWITSIDPEDAWDDETKWIKACPNLGVTVKLEDMRQEALEAANQPESLNAFKRYSLNIRVDAEDQPIATADWDACDRVTPRYYGDMRIAQLLRAHTLKRMEGRICFGGLDLAIIDDSSSLVLLFPPMFPGEKWVLLPYFWIPDENITRRVEKDRVPYNVWRDYGFLTATPGKTTDFEFIAGRIMDISKTFDLRELAYDPALASGLVKLLLTSGLKPDKLVKFAQTSMNYAAPCGDFTRTVVRRELEHDGDPVLRWHITNLRWKRNYTGLIMPDKERSTEKIDGASASIMGFGRGTHPDNAKLIKPKPKVTVL
jgi:phage terminase large subunit-like protein